jgi:CheY-like chemotaxis protein
MKDELVHSPADVTETSPDGWASTPDLESNMPHPIKTVLLAEDSEDDIFLMKMACERSGVPLQLHVVTDGAVAIDYLSGNGPYANRTTYPQPSIVFVDIKMPKQSGFEVLKLIRAKPALKKLPVIMLSNSPLMDDVDRAYQLGVTSYLKKTSDLAELGEAVKVILNYWLNLNISSPLGERKTVDR